MLENYRPISLTNIDYKIIAFVLSERIKKNIQKLIGKDQSAYLENRFIGNNARLLLDMLEYTDNEKIAGIMICLDFKKAFDSLNWEFMIKVLEKVNFGEYFINWVKILYKKPKIVVKNNGYLSETIELQKGIRQGCPFSALLFILCVEVMAITIKNNNNISGIKIDDKEIKIVQHADDSTLLLDNKDSVVEAINEVNRFSKVSGLNLNLSKTEGIWLGINKESGNIFQGITFKNDPVKCLGIYIGHNKEKCVELNWNPKILEFERLFESWKKRKLSLFGKVCIINSLGISKLVYNFSILDTPQYVIKKVNSIIFNFLWKKESVRRVNLIGKIIDGGLNVVDVEEKIAALHAAWVPRLIDDNTSWKLIPCYYINKTGFALKDFIKTSSCDMKDCRFNSFYKSVFESFNKCKNPMNIGIFAEIVWLNEKFKWKNKTMYYKNWIKSGFIYVKDFFNDDGEFYNEQYVCNKLQGSKRNWIIEYMTIRSLIRQNLKQFETGNAKYTNIRYSNFFRFGNEIHNIIGKRSKFFYSFLRDKKFKRHYMEITWSDIFDIPNHTTYFKNVYKQKILNVKYKKLAEFNFKILHNCLPCGKLVSLWNKNVKKHCTRCKTIQDTKHLLYECNTVQHIWIDVGKVLNFKITWKHIVLGFLETGTRFDFRNLVLTIIAYTIFSYWVKFSEQQESFHNVNWKSKISCSMQMYTRIFQHVQKQPTLTKLFVTFIEKYTM